MQKQQIQLTNPRLATALESNNDQVIAEIYKERLKASFEQWNKDEERRYKMMNGDPGDPEIQKMIEEQIKKDMIHKNYTTAQEQFPEFFGSITMLYIDVKVNNWPIQAFVDSGA